MRFHIWLSILLVGPLVAAFVPPEEDAVPFRRDRLPVDVATMEHLSSQMLTLADHFNSTAADDSRTRAQLLALALALDPANRAAADRVEALAGGGEGAAPPTEQAAAARREAWKLLGWLERPEAGPDGRALADCLSDVLARIDPEHPQAAARGGPERGAWTGWVAEPAAFRDRPREPPPTMTPEDEAEDSADDETPPTTATLVRRSSAARVPLWVWSNDLGRTELRSVEMQVRAGRTEKDKDDDKSETSGPEPDIDRTSGTEVRGPGRGRAAAGIARRIAVALEARHGPLPEGLSLRYTLPDGLRLGAGNQGALGGAMLAAADSLFTGIDVEATVLADLGGDRSIHLPPEFWRTLRSLTALDEGGRLILAADAGGFLPALLALDETEFFFGREVLVAGDALAMLDLASANPPERVLKATAAFEEIRQARGTRSLGAFLASEPTRRQLESIAERVPEHASAEILTLRGTSRWPQRLERPVYACEIRRCLGPMRDLLSRPWERINAGDVQRAERQCREELRKLDGMHEAIGDRTELHDPAVNVVKTLSGLGSGIRRMGEHDRIENLVRPVAVQFVEVIRLLSEAANDADTYPIPTAKSPE